MNIEKASPDDRDLIIKFMLDSMIYHHDLDDEYYFDHESSKGALTDFLNNAFIDKKYAVYVARKSPSEISGFAIIAICEATYFDTCIRRYGSVLELYVAPAFRGQKIGKKLMEASENFFRSQGVSYSELQMSSFNQRAFEFYKGLGYTSRQILLFKKI